MERKIAGINKPYILARCKCLICIGIIIETIKNGRYTVEIVLMIGSSSLYPNTELIIIKILAINKYNSLLFLFKIDNEWSISDLNWIEKTNNIPK